MKLYLLIRRTQKYYQTGEIDLGYMIPDHQKIMAAIDSWDFVVPYLDFRRELRKISELSWQTNDFDGIIPWSDKKAWEALPEGSWVVPMDEDDWLAPYFVKTLKSLYLPAGCDQITWDVFRKSAAGAKHVNTFEESCGYALKIPCTWPEITNHMVIKPRGYRIDATLALRNETVASLGFMMYQKANDRLGTLKNALKEAHPYMPKCFAPQYKAYQSLLRRALPPSTATPGSVMQD